MMLLMDVKYDDGGRHKYFSAPKAGDCVTRSIAIASGLDYLVVYKDLFERNRAYYAHKYRTKPALANVTRSPRDGVLREVYEPYLFGLGFTWLPLMQVGSGCKVHLRADEMAPYSDCLIARLSRHVTAVMYGVVRDTHDPSRGGTRCVYGIYER
jgi:hypothetical protein